MLTPWTKHTSSSRCSIITLPLDIHVDHIFIHLKVEDIICLRRVNKMFFLLTHEPIIWRRFLERMNIPMPPLRPTFQYSLKATDFEVEQIVTQAISLDDNWRHHRPEIKKRQLFKSDRIVLGLKVLPGGKYLLASERDVKGYRYYLSLYALNHPSGPLILARTETETKIFNIQAKYMEHNGRMGIMTTCLRRRFMKNLLVPGINPSDYGVDTAIDSPVPLDTELLCLWTCLETLDYISDPFKPRDPEQHIKRISSLSRPFQRVTFTSGRNVSVQDNVLYTYNGESHLAFVLQPDAIVFQNLQSGQQASLTLGHFGGAFTQKPHRISAIRILPEQGDILIMRVVKGSDDAHPDAPDLGALEIYALPEMGTKAVATAKETYFIWNKKISRFYVSDAGFPHVSADHPKLRPHRGPPPPISVYIRTEKPNGILQCTIWPKYIEHPATATMPARTTFVYSTDILIAQAVHLTDGLVPHILPGAERAIVYNVPEDDRTDTPALVNLRKYINPQRQPADYPQPEDTGMDDVLRRSYQHVPHTIFRSFKLPHLLREELKKGLAAITWDEGTGRVLVAGKDEEYVRMIDFANVVVPDNRFMQWKKHKEPRIPYALPT
ncbi:hypothetical protein HGRIS_008540 [Hohenbuehelia grisea]|uniref:F-box domain-containing protein n=1 Tax=Hohenbuehelia grisea TaxID=104357 RepID=A0ABR3J9C0_9AGAR